MESFERHVYKKTSYREPLEKEVDSESIGHSIEIAKRKLESILSPDFKDYAVRFMNIEEYRQLIEDGVLVGEFTLPEGFEYPQSCLSELIKTFRNPTMARTNLGATGWVDKGGISSLETRKIIRLIRKIETENKGESREHKMSMIRSIILEYLNHRKNKGTYYPVIYGRLHSALDDIDDYTTPENLLANIDFISGEDRDRLCDEFRQYISEHIKRGSTGSSFTSKDFDAYTFSDIKA